MKKLAIFGLFAAVIAGIVMAVKRRSRVSPEEREEQQSEKRRAMFERMREGMEAMPKDFPPVVMFDNIAAMRETSDRILELLEEGRIRTDELVASAN